MHYRPLAIALAVATLSTPAFAAQNHVLIREDTGWIATAVFPQIDGDSPLRQLARDRAAAITHKDQHDFIVWAKDDVKTNGSPDSQYSYQSTPTVTLMTPKVISILWTNESDIGGEHPNVAYDTLDVGLVHGKPKVLTLTDFFVPGVDANGIAARAIINTLMNDPDAIDVQEGRLNALTPGLVGKFTLGDTAITFVLSPDIAGRFAIDGVDKVKVKYTDLTDLDPSGPITALLHSRK